MSINQVAVTYADGCRWRVVMGYRQVSDRTSLAVFSGLSAFMLVGCADRTFLPTAPDPSSAAQLLLAKTKPGGLPPTAELAFLASVGGSGFSKVVVINADGSNQVTVHSSAVYPPNWSGSGTGTTARPWRLAYNPTYSTINIVDVDTTGGLVNLRNPQSLSFATSALAPRWVPGRDSIVFSSGTALRIVGASGGTPADLYAPADPSKRLNFSAWRSDGNALAFVENSPFVIKVLNRPTGIVTTVVPAGFSNDMRQLDWARTRDELAFSARDASGVMGTWVVSLVQDVDGNLIAAGVPRLVTLAQGWPTWSPNDGQLAIAGIRIVDYPTGATLRQFGNGYAPDWRR